jgi:phosphatidate phosphatase APP1
MFERVKFQLSYSPKVQRTVEASTETRGFIHLQLPWQLPWRTESKGSIQLQATGVETHLGRIHLGFYETHNPPVYFLNENVKYLVVSDIDDTIKDSNIADSTSIRGILKSVFRGHYYTYEAIAGMAELYRDLANKGALIVYLTSTPYQLTPFLLKFLSECKFPEGPVFPRWLGYGKTRHKWRTMHKILSNMGNQDCFLVGDSGELDLEIYRRICENKAFAHKVKNILIRNVPGTQKLVPGHPREVMYDSLEELRERFRPILES